MDYRLDGDFIEACDCYTVCPCWVDDEPDEGHCTGLFAWVLDPGSRIGGTDVGGRTVVSVTTHLGSRRGGDSATALYVDSGADQAQLDLLARAFAGELDGPLADLAAVSGAVLSRQRAAIRLEPSAGGRSGWTLTVSVAQDGAECEVVRSSGVPKVFDDGAPLTLQHTALHAELGLHDRPVTGQQGEHLAVRVGQLAGGYLEVTGRSGMRGTFRYRHSDPAADLPAAEPVAAGHADAG